MKNGETVRQFEESFAEYVGAKHAIAMANGTATLHTALVALGVKPGDRVAVPPLTMAATTIAVLHAGAVPVFVDVDADTWLMDLDYDNETRVQMPVSLYGLHMNWCGSADIDDAAQTLRPHSGCAFTSYSFQASKILPLGEGGMLVTNDPDLAQKAREFSSLGYKMPDGPRIDPATLKSPTYARHHSLGWNYRMSDLTAAEGLKSITPLSDNDADDWGLIPGTVYSDLAVDNRRFAADLYRQAIQGCDWLTPQKVPGRDVVVSSKAVRDRGYMESIKPKGAEWTHDYWTYAVATDTPERCLWLLDAMERHGGERPYPAWRLTYQEPFLEGTRFVKDDAYPPYELYPKPSCPIAEDLQPRLLQFQCNDLASAERNAKALRKCIEEAG